VTTGFSCSSAQTNVARAKADAHSISHRRFVFAD
jgi:hypothetical protein